MRENKDRKMILENLPKLAASALTIHEAAKSLGMQERSFRQLLDEDPEINRAWQNGRQQLWITARSAITESAARGSAYATQILERILDEGQQLRPLGIDASHISTAEMAKLFGVVRQTIHEWNSNRGLPRNEDGTYNLAISISWYNQFCMAKGKRSALKDALYEERKRELEIRLDKSMGRLFTLTKVRSLSLELGLDRDQQDKLKKFINTHRERCVTQSHHTDSIEMHQSN
jgi:DNA-binding transcriptional regulator YiaG